MTSKFGNGKRKLGLSRIIEKIAETTGAMIGMDIFIPMTDEVHYCFSAILEDRPVPKVEIIVDGYSGGLLTGQGRDATGLHALAAPVKTYGEAIPQHLQGADAGDHSPRLQAYLLQQLG